MVLRLSPSPNESNGGEGRKPNAGCFIPRDHIRAFGLVHLITLEYEAYSFVSALALLDSRFASVIQSCMQMLHS